MANLSGVEPDRAGGLSALAPWPRGAGSGFEPRLRGTQGILVFFIHPSIFEVPIIHPQPGGLGSVGRKCSAPFLPQSAWTPPPSAEPQVLGVAGNAAFVALLVRYVEEATGQLGNGSLDLSYWVGSN